MPRHCYVLRVFTRDGVGGNHLGVITDSLGLDDSKMQRVANELGFSETIYLKWFEGPVPTSRIFTPQAELPFAGHPLVGAAWVLLNLAPLDPGGLQCQVGRVGIRQVKEVTWVDAPWIQPVTTVTPDLGSWLSAEETVEVKMPIPYLLVKVGTPAEVAAAVPGVVSDWGEVYVWAWEEEGRSVRARFFAPGVGISEDPATGSAAVALAARMRHHGQGQGRLTIHQGEETGYPSRIHLSWNPFSTSLGGTVVRDEVRFLST